MTVLENFAQLAAKYSSNPRDALTFYVGLLEAHIRSQDELLETFKQELDQIVLELLQEQS